MEKIINQIEERYKEEIALLRFQEGNNYDSEKKNSVFKGGKTNRKVLYEVKKDLRNIQKAQNKRMVTLTGANAGKADLTKEIYILYIPLTNKKERILCFSTGDTNNKRLLVNQSYSNKEKRWLLKYNLGGMYGDNPKEIKTEIYKRLLRYIL